MTLRVSGKNLDIGEALRSQVQARMAGALSKYFDGGYSGHVTVTRDGAGFRTECVLHLTSGMTLEASGAAQDAYASFDQTAGRIENRLRRYKQRLKGRSGPPGSRVEASYSVLAAPDDEADRGGGLPSDGDCRNHEAAARVLGQRRRDAARYDRSACSCVHPR